MSSYDIHVGDDEELGDRARTVRRAVFIEEQGVSEAEEMDGRDGDAIQLLVTNGDEPVGTARVRFPDSETAKIERVAVRASHRGEGLGVRLMERAEDCARDEGATAVVLHAQRRVEGFYRSLGYETVSDEFLEAEIPHVEMEKRVASG